MVEAAEVIGFEWTVFFFFSAEGFFEGVLRVVFLPADRLVAIFLRVDFKDADWRWVVSCADGDFV